MTTARLVVEFGLTEENLTNCWKKLLQHPHRSQRICLKIAGGLTLSTQITEQQSLTILIEESLGSMKFLTKLLRVDPEVCEELVF